MDQSGILREGQTRSAPHQQQRGPQVQQVNRQFMHAQSQVQQKPMIQPTQARSGPTHSLSSIGEPTHNTVSPQRAGAPIPPNSTGFPPQNPQNPAFIPNSGLPQNRHHQGPSYPPSAYPGPQPVNSYTGNTNSQSSGSSLYTGSGFPPPNQPGSAYPGGAYPQSFTGATPTAASNTSGPAGIGTSNLGSFPINPQTAISHSTAAPMPPTGSRPSYAQSQAVSSRIASANAAIAAIQSVQPPLIPPVPRNRPTMVNVGLPQLPGGDLKGTIQYDQAQGTEVVNEKTAQKSASEFTTFLSQVRTQRLGEWDSFWHHRLELNREILLNENECFKSAQDDAQEFEDSDDEDSYRRGRPITVPYMYTNVGSFDIPPPKPVLMPDPEMVMRNSVQAQTNAQLQAHAHAQMQADSQAQQQAQQHAIQMMMRRQQQIRK